MAGYVMKMSILVSNINRCTLKDSSFKVRHKAYACPLQASRKKRNQRITMKFLLHKNLEMPTLKTAHPAKTHKPSLETNFLQEELFSCLHTRRNNKYCRIKPKLFKYGF
jgi:hypothetical protein